MPANKLIAGALLLALAGCMTAPRPRTASAPIGDPVAETAARVASYGTRLAVDTPELYQPSEVVRGAPRSLMVASTPGIDVAALASAQAYADTQGTMALIVMRRGEIAYERYADGYTPGSRFSPASMAKTVMALSYGAARIPLDARVDRWLTEWRGDPRGAITVRQLLQMSSGLETPPFVPDPAGLSAQIMFSPDIVAAALKLRQVAPPGSVFSYSNGNSQLAGAVLERATGQRYADWLSRTIWQPIGASDATVWLDRGDGSAHFFCCLQATARDWGRVGQLILDRGRAGQRQVVPAAWIDEMAKPAATNPNYGLQLWRGSPYVARRTYSPGAAFSVPSAKPFLRDDVVFMDGAIGQRVYVVPSAELVIVRIGKSNFSWDDTELVNRVLAGLPPR